MGDVSQQNDVYKRLPKLLEDPIIGWPIISMQSPLRAGLLSLVFSLILVLSAAAPIYPDNAFSSSSLSRHATTDSLAPVSSLNLVHNIARARHIVNEDGVAIRDTAAALNSRGFFDAIANGFKVRRWHIIVIILHR